MSRLSPQHTPPSQSSPQRGEKRKSPIIRTQSLSSSDTSKRQKLSYDAPEVSSQQQVASSSQHPSVLNTTAEQTTTSLTPENLPEIAEAFTHVLIKLFGTLVKTKDPLKPYVDFEIKSEIKSKMPIPKGFTQIHVSQDAPAQKLSWLQKSRLSPNILNNNNGNNQCTLSFETIILLFSSYQDYHINGDKNPIDDKTLEKMPFNKNFVEKLLGMKNMIADLKNDQGQSKFLISTKFDDDLLCAIKKHNETSDIQNRSVFNIMQEKKGHSFLLKIKHKNTS